VALKTFNFEDFYLFSFFLIWSDSSVKEVKKSMDSHQHLQGQTQLFIEEVLEFTPLPCLEVKSP